MPLSNNIPNAIGRTTFIKNARSLLPGAVSDPLTVGTLTVTTLFTSPSITDNGTTVSVTSNIYPDADNTYQLGESATTKRWKEVYTINADVLGVLTVAYMTHDGSNKIPVGSDLVPNLDSTYSLGNDSTPLRWANVHTDQVTFNDGTSLTSASAFGSLIAEWTAGETLAQGDIVYISAADTVSKVTTSTADKAIGRAQAAITGGNTGSILMYGPLAVVVADGSITAGNYVIAASTAGRVANGGTAKTFTFGGTIDASTDTLKQIALADHTHGLNNHAHDITSHTHTNTHGHGFTSSSTGSNHQHSAGTYSASSHAHGLNSHTHSVSSSGTASVSGSSAFAASSTHHHSPWTGTTGPSSTTQFSTSGHTHSVSTTGTAAAASGNTALNSASVTGSSGNDGGHTHSSSSVSNYTGNTGGTVTTVSTSGNESGTTVVGGTGSSGTLEYFVNSTHTHPITGLTLTETPILGIAKTTASIAGDNITVVLIR